MVGSFQLVVTRGDEDSTVLTDRIALKYYIQNETFDVYIEEFC